MIQAYVLTRNEKHQALIRRSSRPSKNSHLLVLESNRRGSRCNAKRRIACEDIQAFFADAVEEVLIVGVTLRGHASQRRLSNIVATDYRCDCI